MGQMGRLNDAACGHLLDMLARLLLGIGAALRAVLITGQADLLSNQSLSWPRLKAPRTIAAHPGDHEALPIEASAA